MTDNRLEKTRAVHFGRRCSKKCFAAVWDHGERPRKHGGVGTLRCQFNIPSPTADVISYQLYMCFVIKKHAKGDEVLSWYAEVYTPLTTPNLLASQRWPDSLEAALDWARMVVALHEAENPLNKVTYG